MLPVPADPDRARLPLSASRDLPRRSKGLAPSPIHHDVVPELKHEKAPDERLAQASKPVDIKVIRVPDLATSPPSTPIVILQSRSWYRRRLVWLVGGVVSGFTTWFRPVSRHRAYLRQKGWAMSSARLVVTAVRIEGRTKAEVSRDYGVSPRWVYELCRRFDAEGEAGLVPRSRRPVRALGGYRCCP
jgi:hypothetical protein